MEKYWNIFVNGYTGYGNYLWNEITHPSWKNYFYWLIVVSLFFFAIEIYLPWRKKQEKLSKQFLTTTSIIIGLLFVVFLKSHFSPHFDSFSYIWKIGLGYLGYLFWLNRQGEIHLRKDFWLDFFYMFFNFFLFSLIIYNAASDVIVNLFNDGIKAIAGGFDLQAQNPLQSAPMWAILIIGFLVRDFVQWWIHRLLHKSDKLWEFHKVHHSVEQMGFAAHLRYHWMENIVYRSLEYLPLALLGIGLYDFFIIHIFTLAWGHYNHSNISVSGHVTGGILGGLIGIVFANSLMNIHLFEGASLPIQIGIVVVFTALTSLVLGKGMKCLFNSPEMHIWHHAYELPEDRRTGVNFGLTLAIWDYLFKTAYIPHDGQNIRLGFPGVEAFPDNFSGQIMHGFRKGGIDEYKNE